MNFNKNGEAHRQYEYRRDCKVVRSAREEYRNGHGVDLQEVHLYMQLCVRTRESL